MIDPAQHPLGLLLFGWLSGLFTGILGTLCNVGYFIKKTESRVEKEPS